MAKAKKHEDTPNPCLSKMEKSSNYRDKCKNPPSRVGGSGSSPYRNQVHHILCEHAISQVDTDDDAELLSLINLCKCMVDWDINNEDNLIALPLKSAYRYSGGSNPVNMCCHNVDHLSADGYSKECADYLNEFVWKVVKKKQKVHAVNVANLLQALKDCTTEFTTRLQDRGIRNNGTQKSWIGRGKQPNWHHPFSMALVPTDRSPGGGRNLPILKMIK